MINKIVVSMFKFLDRLGSHIQRFLINLLWDGVFNDQKINTVETSPALVY